MVVAMVEHVDPAWVVQTTESCVQVVWELGVDQGCDMDWGSVHGLVEQGVVHVLGSCETGILIKSGICSVAKWQRK